MNINFLSQINYLGVIVSSIIYFFLGSLWFSALFGSIWGEELQKHGVTIKEPTKGCLATKMAITFICNFLTALAMASLVVLTGSKTIITGLILGIIASLGFAVSTVLCIFTWESRSCKLFLIDIGYPVLGIILLGVILSLFH